MEGCASGSVDTRLLEDGDRKVAHDDVDFKVAVDRDVGGKVSVDAGNYGRFAYGLFRLRSVCLRLELIRLRLICQFTYVLKYVLQQLIHLLYLRSRSHPSRSIQFLERDS